MVQFKNILPGLLSCQILLLSTMAAAAFDFNGIGAAPLSLGNSLVACRSNPYAIYYNPANITVERENVIETGYRSFYGLTWPVQTYLLAQCHVKKVPFSFFCSSLGSRIYQELHLAMGSSYTYQNEISLGISLNLYYLTIAGYSSSVQAGINLGLSYPLSSRFTMGVLITNLNQPKFSVINEKLPQIFTVGWCYSLHQNIMLCCDLYRDVKFEQDYRAGIAVSLKPGLNLRIGLEDKNNTCSMGLGIKFKSFRFDYALLLHNILGISHAASLQMTL